MFFHGGTGHTRLSLAVHQAQSAAKWLAIRALDGELHPENTL